MYCEIYPSLFLYDLDNLIFLIGDERDSLNCRLHREPLNRDLTLQSDFDADVSSLDTDVPDNSDN